VKPTRSGQIVRFHTPNEDEDPEQLYLVREVIEDGEKSRIIILALNTGYSFPWTSLVYLNDLEVDELRTFQLDYYLKYGDHGLF